MTIADIASRLSPDDLGELLGPSDLVTALLKRPAWMEDAACSGRGTRPFFPEVGDTTDEAKRLCGLCSVRTECLAYAVADPEVQGIWGGTSAKERARMRRKVA